MRLWRANRYVAHKQHLLPGAPPGDLERAAGDQRRVAGDLERVVGDLVALHATAPTGPYLSLWARAPGFGREMLEQALYERRTLVRLLCMRTTLHVVRSDEAHFFFQAYAERRIPAERHMLASLLVQAGLCREEQAGAMLEGLQRQVLDAVAERGPATVRQIGEAVPELKAKVRHSVDKPYAGEFSIGSRLVPSLCNLGLLARARPQGTWLSNLHTYTSLADWLPVTNLASVTPRDARRWLVRRYLAAFGPATADDVQWWTGFTVRETQEALDDLGPERVEVNLEELGAGYLMLADDARQFRNFSPAEDAGVFLLPGLDPYIMGYGDRRRFLAAEHEAKVLDRAGNAMPTVWVDGRVTGAWGQRKDGSIVCGLFEPIGREAQAALEGQVERLEGFVAGEYLRPRSETAFCRALR
jgi:hypothetical protein